VGFSGPPSEPDVRLSPHPALHVLTPRHYSPMVWGYERLGSDTDAYWFPWRA